MPRRQLMIRSVKFNPDGPETRTKRRELRNSVIEKRIRVGPLVDVNIGIEDLSRDLRIRKLDIRDKRSFLIGWYEEVTAPTLVASPELIDRFVLNRIESLREEMARCRRGTKTSYRAKIDVMKDGLGLAKDKNGNWRKNQTEITHALKIPSKFGITTDHAILSIGKDGLTITPLTEQEGWVKMITPKVYTFNVNFKPGESAMVKFGFKW